MCIPSYVCTDPCMYMCIYVGMYVRVYLRMYLCMALLTNECKFYRAHACIGVWGTTIVGDQVHAEGGVGDPFT